MADTLTLWHEKLDVYRNAVAFVSQAEDILSGFSSAVAVSDHLDRVAESVVAQIMQLRRIVIVIYGRP